MRLRRADTSRPGYTRRRRGKAFSYTDATGAPLTDPAELDRVKSLVIPPAWRDVWICPDPRGHIQATGTDAAGRRQYRYHDQWRVKRDAAKFDHVLEVARHLPELREQVAADLARRGYGRERVLAAAARLLDVGVFRIGGEAYASDDDPSGEATYGLATLRREHVKVRGATMDFQYPAKGGVERSQRIVDADTAKLLKALLKQDVGTPELLAFRTGRQWHDVRSDDINSYLKEHSGGCEISAKDFRTWHATVLAAVVLAGAPASSKAGRRKAVVAAMKQVSGYLGNTPSVAKASYVDPRVVDLYNHGTVLDLPPGDPLTAHGARSQAEKALLELLSD
ncbi:DNA topoisomerase IB [Pseudonocardia humida]|uniref:DNA topoisomerase n=1 Tax=Pseudonocardia humida TaxID=2800819 RepID=A0ABT1AC01_9PSEU|nr:DNA topoisomerase IB [Pseudonocardia humida]MCO1660329.1 DNA topoisomerase IB [Pseudonocardia humida]